jgi:hypothetical protein
VRSTRREVWEVLQIWWFTVPGLGLGVLAIVQTIRDTRHETPWFWGFLAMTALAFATGWRLRKVAKDRNKAEAALGEESSRDAVALRMDRFARELEALREEIPPDQEGPGPLYSHEQEDWIDSLRHFSERVAGELRQNAPGFMAYWRQELESSSIPQRLTRTAAEEQIDFGLQQLHRIAERLRAGHDQA